MKIKILQWNIWYWEKIENVVKQIKALYPDIICLQELSINGLANRNINTAEYVKDALNFHSYFVIAQHLHNDDDLGNGIFSRFPVTKTSATFIQQPSDKPIDFAHEGRLYIEAELQINHKTITIGTVHSSYTPAFKETEAKKKEVDNLLGIAEKKKGDFILTGDFNAIPESYMVTEMDKLLDNLGPNKDQKTWTTKPFDYQGFKEDKLNWRLDYIFGTKDINAVSAEIIQTKYSDHLPLLVTIELR